MKTIITLIKYDYLQRVRSYRFLIILCASLAFAAILIPEAGSNYSTISIGDYLGHNNSAWIAYVTAIMSSLFISLLGYYIINNSIGIDQNTKVGYLIASSNTTNFRYLMAKFWGNFLMLLTIVFCILIVSIILFYTRNTGYAFEPMHFLAAYLLIPLPSIIFISALAILLEIIFKKKSTIQNVIFFILFTIMVSQSWMGINGDPFGIQLPTQEMVKQVNALDTAADQHGLNIGFVIRQNSLEKRFEFTGTNITPLYILFRVLWPLLGIFIIYLASRFFHRFELNEKGITLKLTSPKPYEADVLEIPGLDLSRIPQLEKSTSIWPVIKVEFLMMMRKGSKWLWVLNIIGMALLVITPISAGHKFVLPVLWFLQVHRWADLVSKEKAHQVHYFVYSSYNPIQRILSAQFLSGISLAIILALPLIIRYIVLGNWIPIMTILLGTIFLIGLSAFVGIASGGKRLFEILFFFLAYLNVNGVPFTDYYGGMNQSISYLIILFSLTITLVVMSYLLRKLELRRI